jgi:TRAP-type C4-dicarboxylate transport system substrate-binding protein
MRQNEFSTVLNDTEHSLFLTSIVMTNHFWNGLSPKLQEAIAAAAKTAAHIEREEAIRDAEATKVKCAQEGIEIATLSAGEQAKFKSMTGSLYRKYASYFNKGLIESIQQTK